MFFKNDTMTVFLDTPLQDLEYLSKINNKPIVVLNNHKDIIGVLEGDNLKQSLFKNHKGEIPLNLLNQSFLTINNFTEFKEGFTDLYEYVILKNGFELACYPMIHFHLKFLKFKNEQLLKNNLSLHEELEKALTLNDDFKRILDSSYDEIFVTDAEGNTLFVSESSKKLTGLPPESFVGKNVKDLEKKGMLINSVTLKTMNTETIQSATQVYPNGRTVLSTAQPIFDHKGCLYRIVSNTRDISELVNIKEKLNQMTKNSEIQLEDQKEIFYYKGLITGNKQMKTIIKTAQKIAPLNSSIFIHGESGVGKGALAKFIHDQSPRRSNKFVQVNCGAIPSSLIESELFGYVAGAFTGAAKKGKSGLVELAKGGTLFLDEIGEMPIEMQVKLLQLVQDKTFIKVGGTKEINADIRIISATNKDLKMLISENRFREDLYYRLHVVPISIPPLRDRKDDILILIDYFIYKFNKSHSQTVSIDEHSKLLLQLHEYPGNIRELENLIEQIVVTSQGSTVYKKDLPDQFQSQYDPKNLYHSMTLKQAIEQTEKQVISYALKSNTTTRELADALNVSQTTIMRKLKKYELST